MARNYDGSDPSLSLSVRVRKWLERAGEYYGTMTNESPNLTKSVSKLGVYMARQLLYSLVAVLAAYPGSAPPASYPWSAPDSAYTEILALRISTNKNASAPSVADWPAAPPAVHNITQLAGGRLGGAAGAWLLAAGNLFFVAVPPMDPAAALDTDSFRAAAMPTFTQLALTGLGGSGGNLTQVAVDAAGELLAVVEEGREGRTASLIWVRCANKACRVSGHSPIRGRPQNVKVSAGGKYMYISTQAPPRPPQHDFQGISGS